MKPAILFLLCAALWPLQATACRCQEPGPSAAYKRADAVADIRIDEVSVLEGDITQARAEVLQSWKSVLPRSLSVYTGEDCMYPLAKGNRYLLYLKRDDQGRFGTYVCRGNLDHSRSANRVRWLNKHGKPLAVTP